MASDRALAILVVASACGFDAVPQPEALSAPVGSTVVLQADGPERSEDDTRFDWVVAERPEGSDAPLSQERVDSVELFLDRSGYFAIDRWLETGASETWTHRYYVQATPAPPVAKINGPSYAVVGQIVELRGGVSFDPDGNDLHYVWQLARRPRDSSVTIDVGSVDWIEIQPDVVGWYSIELDVFDGAEWSQTTAVVDLNVRAPI